MSDIDNPTTNCTLFGGDNPALTQAITSTTDGSKERLDVNTLGVSEVCDCNLTTTPLGISGVFTGTWKDILKYAHISIQIKADQDSATDGLAIQWSTDGVNVLDTDYFTVFANQAKVFTFGCQAQYWRIVYTNGAVAQSSFNLTPLLKSFYQKSSSHRISDQISNQDDAELVKAVLTGEDEDGDFQNVATSPSGELDVRMIQNIKTSEVNWTETNLASGATWTGTSESTFGINAVQFYHYSNEPCTVYIDQSADETNWDIVDTFPTLGGTGYGEVVQSVAPFYRARVKNEGASTTTTIRFYTGKTPFVNPLPRALSYDGRLKCETTLVSSSLALPLEIKYDKSSTAINANEWQVAAQYVVPDNYNFTATAFKCHSATTGETAAVFNLIAAGTFDCPSDTFTDGDAISAPEFASGIGLMVTTATPASPALGDDVTITYTNSVGTTGRTATINVPKSSPIGTNLDVVLQGDDIGVRDITNITHSATGAAGAYNMVMYYAFFEELMTSANIQYNAVSIAGSPIQFPSGSTLTIAFLAGTKVSYRRHLSMVGTLNPT